MPLDARQQKLTKRFGETLKGQFSVTTCTALHFLEALYSQPEPVSCLGRIISSSYGLPSVKNAFHSPALNIDFFNNHATKTLLYLRAPELKNIAGGDYIQRIVRVIAEPPVFWHPFTDAFKEGNLSTEGRVAFAWLLLQLVSLPGADADTYRELVQEHDVVTTLLNHTDSESHAIGSQLKHVVETRSVGASTGTTVRPGGRHDNDHIDFRMISILPTADELTSQQPTFLRTAEEVEQVSVDQRVATHLDNQFRLYREDMLHELRNELQIALGLKKGRHSGLIVDRLTLVDMYGVALEKGQRGRPERWGLVLRCPSDYDFWFFKKDAPSNRVKYLLEDRNRRYIKDLSIATLVVDGDCVAFPVIRRVERLLAKEPPEFVLHFSSKQATVDFLCRSRGARNVQLIQIDTAVFSYEPVLCALQSIVHFPLAHDLIISEDGSDLEPPPSTDELSRLEEAIRQDPSQDLRPLLELEKSVKLDGAQASALLSGLGRRVAIIQGPPGTGKSFIGALLTRILHDATSEKILVCCYTNHSLDQFLEDLLDIGVPEDSIVRLGGKSTPRTAPLSLQNQKQSAKLGRGDRAEINLYRSSSVDALDRLTQAFRSPEVSHGIVSHATILTHLEFDDPQYFLAFSVPPTRSDEGMQQVGANGKAVAADYLIARWLHGKDAGIFQDSDNVCETAHVWEMTCEERQKRYKGWQDAAFRELLTDVYEHGSVFDGFQKKLERKFAESDGHTLASKRIIGCTTTAAAKYMDILKCASPGIVVVEEAGEILESHVLTTLGERTQRLIMIGDHKQLRPKVDNYQLTVEKGDGYDLNRSLFERLILKGYKHETLETQHRMRPEISSYVKRLTYPKLQDAPATLKRPNTRGLRDNIVFIAHGHSEDENDKLPGLRPEGTKPSKQNSYEVEMVLKIVRYLGQQGYGTDQIVVLTPYLGQLHRLQEALRKDNDPVLSDLDSFALVKAGLRSASAARAARKPIRLSTVDNFQGEERDIVIVSLVRSNSNDDIGFMFSPERLNVLLSRARNALIMIGNPDTFLNARKGRELWTSFLAMLRQDGHFYDGLPVKCEQHSARTGELSRPEQFELDCPEGGCKEACPTSLGCGHPCPSRCHYISTHSKMQCNIVQEHTCSAGHRWTWKCHERRSTTCPKCERATEVAEEKRRKDVERQKQHDAELRDFQLKMARLDEEMEDEREVQQQRDRERQRLEALHLKEQARDDLIARGREQVAQETHASDSPSPSPSPPSSPSPSSSLAPSSADPVESCSSAGPTSPSSTPPTALIPLAPSTDSVDDLASACESGSNNILPASPSELEWQRQKDMEDASNLHIDAIMNMTGLEDVKQQVLRIKAKIDVSKRQGTSVKDERFNIVLLGNPGTGKTTIARHYAAFLSSVGVLPGSSFFETTGSRLASDGVKEIKKELDKIIKSGGGAVFIDEAYQLVGGHNFGGSQVLDFLLAEMENHIGKLVFILAGYNKQMEKFFEHNPGLISRVPYCLKFCDYTDRELLTMLAKLVSKKYSDRMQVEGGIFGLYTRIAVRRLARGRGRDGFGNARALHLMFAAISERQAARLTEQRKTGAIPDDFLFAKEDIIGPDPSRAVLTSQAWVKLMALTGLGDVKKSVQTQFELIAENYRRELREKEPIQMSLNCVFLGNPGTGKTTVAKLYGQVLADLGLLSNGEVVLKNPSDFIGNVIGDSEARTKAILAASAGKVLVIDEAYMLYGGGRGSDSFKSSVIDTIVAEIQSVPGEDRAVIMCGYEPQMKEMFQHVNPGLSRRFRIEEPFRFADFTDAELLEILDLKLKQQNLSATAEAKAVALDVLSRAKNRPNFGNGGEVENMLGLAKLRAQARRSVLPPSQRPDDIVFEPADIDCDFDRVSHSSDNLKQLFEDVVGCEKIVEKLAEYQNIARVTRQRGKDIRETRDLIPTNFVFKGPPGTGKTTTARKMGQVYYDMGFLSSTDVVECSASDLVGRYVGHTGPKTRDVFRKALGKVLIIDEAYRLGQGSFAKEAMDELVGMLTQEEFAAKLVVILAGYDQEMNQLMAVNTGLSSRFPDEIIFEHLSPDSCLRILERDLAAKEITCQDLSAPSTDSYRELTALLAELSSLPSWGNARDVKTLATKIVRAAYKRAAEATGADMALAGADAVACVRSMLDERKARAKERPSSPSSPPLPTQELLPPVSTPPATNTASATCCRGAPPSEDEPPKDDDPTPEDERDPGVSDAVWAQLQVDKKAAAEERARIEAAIRDLELAAEEAKEAEKAEELRRKLEAEKERQQREKRIQKKIQQMGLCPYGYEWIKQSKGYRCAGGGHWVSNDDLGL